MKKPQANAIHISCLVTMFIVGSTLVGCEKKTASGAMGESTTPVTMSKNPEKASETKPAPVQQNFSAE